MRLGTANHGIEIEAGLPFSFLFFLKHSNLTSDLMTCCDLAH